MRSFRLRWATVFFAATVFFFGCDLPTGGPSFETEAEVNGPVVMEKTFSFLGGPTSENEPLVDTTTSTFESLFAIGDDPAQSIFIEEEVSAFDVGSLDEALDEAAQDVGVDATLSSTVLQDSELATQEVDAGYREANGVFESDPVSAERPIERSGTDDTVELPFPVDSLGTPPFGGANATIQSVVLTDETTRDGTTVNQLTFTLENDQANSTSLTDGSEGPPVLEIQDASNDRLVAARFPDPVAPGESETVDIGVASRMLGEGTDLVLTIDGSNPRDVTLRIHPSPLRYQETTLENVDEVNVEGDTSDVSTVERTETQFAGIEVRRGTVQFDITNHLSFPITVDSLTLDNNPASLGPLPNDFSGLNVSKGVSDSIPPGQTETLSLDLGGKGISSAVDVKLRITSAQTGGTVTFTADGGLGASVNGTLTVGTLYFWPDGEEFQAGGSVDFETDRVRFERSSDFVELDAGTLAFDDLVSEPHLAFDAFAVSFPDLTQPPYAPGDSLVLRFTQSPNGDFEFSPIGVGDPDGGRDIEVDLSDLRLSPTGNRVDYHVQGTLETIPAATRTATNLRSIRFEDEVSADVSVGALDVRALEAGVKPFSVSVTNDADGDGRLDVADEAESRVASIEGFGSLAGQLKGLQLEGSHLTFSIETDAGTNARLYAALQGRQGNTRTFLAGRGDRRVASSDTLGDDFYRGSTRIAAEDLIQFGIRGAPTDAVVTRSLTLTDDNSSVDDFVSALPTSLRFSGQALLTGDEENRIRLRRPLTFEAGLNLSVPVRFKKAFTVRDTVDADLTSLQDFTDPNKNVTVSSATLKLEYTNQVPLGATVEITVLDADDEDVLQLPGEGEAFRVKPASKTGDGTTADSRSGTISIDLTEEEVQNLAKGERLLLRLTVDQQQEGPPATVRTTDTIQLSLRAKVKGTVSTGK